jgi:hypothetical protein
MLIAIKGSPLVVMRYFDAVLRARRQNQAPAPTVHQTDTHTRTGIMLRQGTCVELLNHVTITVYLVMIKVMSSSERPLGDNPFNGKKEWFNP